MFLLVFLFSWLSHRIYMYHITSCLYLRTLCLFLCYRITCFSAKSLCTFFPQNFKLVVWFIRFSLCCFDVTVSPGFQFNSSYPTRYSSLAWHRGHQHFRLALLWDLADALHVWSALTAPPFRLWMLLPEHFNSSGVVRLKPPHLKLPE